MSRSSNSSRGHPNSNSSILDADMHREILNLSTDSDTLSEVPTVSAAPLANFATTILTPMLNKEIDDLSCDSDSDFDDFTPEKVNFLLKCDFIFQIRAMKGR